MKNFYRKINILIFKDTNNAKMTELEEKSHDDLPVPTIEILQIKNSKLEEQNKYLRQSLEEEKDLTNF